MRWRAVAPEGRQPNVGSVHMTRVRAPVPLCGRRSRPTGGAVGRGDSARQPSASRISPQPSNPSICTHPEAASTAVTWKTSPRSQRTYQRPARAGAGIASGSGGAAGAWGRSLGAHRFSVGFRCCGMGLTRLRAPAGRREGSGRTLWQRSEAPYRAAIVGFHEHKTDSAYAPLMNVTRGAVPSGSSHKDGPDPRGRRRARGWPHGQPRGSSSVPAQ